LEWLLEAKKRYGVSILNYSVTSNHIHLIVRDPRGEEAIARSVQLIAGRTGAGIQPEKETERSLLGGSVSRNGGGGGFAFGSVHGLCGFEHGACRCCETSVGVGFLRVQ